MQAQGIGPQNGVLLPAAGGPAGEQGPGGQHVQIVSGGRGVVAPDSRRGGGIELGFLGQAAQRPEPLPAGISHRRVTVAENRFHPALPVGLVQQGQIAKTLAAGDHAGNLLDIGRPLVCPPLGQVAQGHAQGQGVVAHGRGQAAHERLVG